jgi:ketosteroid isomerase-like protein
VAFEHWASDYFDAKSEGDLERLVANFDDEIVYEDMVLCRRTQGAQRLRETYAALFRARSGPAASRLLWSAGDSRGRAVLFRNEAGLFGAPMDVVGVVELDGWKVTRQRDHWDGRNLPDSVLADIRRVYPPHHSPSSMRSEQATAACPELEVAAARLRDHIAGAGAPSGLAEGARFVDLALGVEVTGRSQIADFLAHRAGVLPYGTGARETNVVGGTSGGALEWAASPDHAATVGVGVTAVGLDSEGRVTRLVVAWDASRVDPDVVRGWAAARVRPSSQP